MSIFLKSRSFRFLECQDNRPPLISWLLHLPMLQHTSSQTHLHASESAPMSFHLSPFSPLSFSQQLLQSFTCDDSFVHTTLSSLPLTASHSIRLLEIQYYIQPIPIESQKVSFFNKNPSGGSEYWQDQHIVRTPSQVP